MSQFDDFAHVRLVPPVDSRLPERVCDVEVSSDGGKTWAGLPINRVFIDSGVGDLTTITPTIVAVPDLVDVRIVEREQ